MTENDGFMVENDFEKGCQWHFGEQSGGGDTGYKNPMSENFKKNRYASLIRESIQNSLDAIDDKTRPVTASFQFKEIRCDRFPNFFELRKDIDGCLFYYKNNRDAQEKYMPMSNYFGSFLSPNNRSMPYLVISDFNTIGMDYSEGDTNCSFYAFVRSGGVTSKGTDSAGGSFGFGKAAYFDVSQISTLLVSTKTKSGDCFFEGVSSLCTHEKEGKKRTAVGFYDNNDGNPVSEEEKIPRRFLRKDEAGTDIYIMGIDVDSKEEIIEEMLEAVLRNFWLSIYKNKLVVRIEDITKDKSTKYEVKSENIADYIEHYFRELIDTNNRSTYNPHPYFDAVRFAEKKDGYRLFEEELHLLGKVRFYIFKDKDAKDRISYMRAPLMLVYAKKYQTSYGFYGVFVCEDEKGNEKLRRMENPAHDEWTENNWKVKGRTSQEAKDTMKELDSFIRRCVSELFKTEKSSILDIPDLENFLYIPTALEEDEKVLGHDEIQDDSNHDIPVSLQPNLLLEKPKLSKPSLSMGKVLIERKTSAVVSSNGELYSGHSGTRSHTKGGGVGSRKLDIRNVFNEEGKQGSYAEPVWVNYRTFAQSHTGGLFYHIIVYSNIEIENGKISLVIAGEQEDDKINIIDTNKGQAYQNIVSRLHLLKGKNEIIVRLSDNMKHALKLKVYESK